MISKRIIYKFPEEVINNWKNAYIEVGFSERPLPSIFKSKNYRRDSPTIWKTWLVQTYIEKISWYLLSKSQMC